MLGFVGVSAPALAQDEEPSLEDELYKARQVRARELLKSGKVEEAYAVAWLIVSSEPDRYGAWLRLGEIMMLDDTRRAETRRVLERAREADEESSQPLQYLAVLDHLEKKPEAEADHYAAAARLDFESFDLQMIAAQKTSAVKRFDEAIEFFRVANKLKAGDYGAVSQLGNTLIITGHYSEAVEVYRVGYEANASTDFIVSMIHALLSGARYDEALTEIAKYQKDEGFKKKGSLLFTLSIQSARAHLGKMTLAEAEEALRTGLREHPELPPAYTLRARYLLGLTLSMQSCSLEQTKQCGGDAPAACCSKAIEALEHFNAVLGNDTADSSHPDLRLRKGLIEGGAGLLDGSKKTLEEYVGVRKGLAQLGVGDLIDAEGTINKNIKKNRDKALGEAFGASAVTLFAFYERDGDDRDLQGAIRFYREAIARAPDFNNIDRLRTLRRWPPHAIDAITKLKALSDKQLSAANASDKAKGCSCQAISRPAQDHPISWLWIGALLCIGGLRSRRAHV